MCLILPILTKFLKILLPTFVFFADWNLINVHIIIMMRDFMLIFVQVLDYSQQWNTLRLMKQVLIYSLMKSNINNTRQFTLQQREVDQRD
jgi:hypothetical protein